MTSLISANLENINKQESPREITNAYSQIKQLLSSFSIADAELEFSLKEWVYQRIISSLDLSALNNDQRKKLIEVSHIILNATQSGLSDQEKSILSSFFRDINALDKKLLFLCISKENGLEMLMRDFSMKEAISPRSLKEEMSLMSHCFTKIVDYLQPLIKKENEQLIEDVNNHLEVLERFDGVGRKYQGKKQKMTVLILENKEDIKFFNYIAEADIKISKKLTTILPIFNNRFKEVEKILSTDLTAHSTYQMKMHLNSLILYLRIVQQAIEIRQGAHSKAPTSKQKEDWELEEHIDIALNEFEKILNKVGKSKEKQEILDLLKGTLKTVLEPLQYSTNALKHTYLSLKTMLKQKLEFEIKQDKKGQKETLENIKKGVISLQEMFIQNSWSQHLQEKKENHDQKQHLGVDEDKLEESMQNSHTFFAMTAHYLTQIQQKFDSYYKLSSLFSVHLETELEAIDEYEQESAPIEETPPPQVTKQKQKKNHPTPSQIKEEPIFQEEPIIEEVFTLPAIEKKLLDKESLIEFIQDATKMGIKSKKSIADSFSLESTDHFFMAGCGFEIFAKLLFEGQLQHVGALFPSLLLDWHVQIEQALSSKYVQTTKNPVPPSHSLTELAYTCKEGISKEIQNWMEEIDQGVIWSRYPFSSLERYESKNKVLPAGLAWLKFSHQLLEGKIPAKDELEKFVRFVVRSHYLSLQFERQFKGTSFFSHLLQHFQPNGCVEITLLDLLSNKPTTKHIHEGTKKALELMHELQSKVLHSPLKDCQHHLLRLDASQELSERIHTPHLVAWHTRHCTNIQWAIESLYVMEYFNQTKQLLYIHDFKLFQQLLRDENESAHQTLLKFNFGIGAHYPRRKGASDEFFKPFIQSIENSKRAYETNKEESHLLKKTQKLIQNEALPAICALLKKLRPVTLIKV